MYSYEWDEQTGGYILNTTPLEFSKEPRPVYYKELDILGFDKKWKYPKSDVYPLLWAESNNYYYRGRLVAKTKGGSIYHAPEIIFLDDPEPNGDELRFVDIPAMVEKNREILESLTQETIKKVYNTYCEFKNKVDIFHVSFSGGKDSEVTLDIIQRALPHNSFVVIFGDTGMEFPDTYQVVELAKERCSKQNIQFYEAKSKFNPLDSWKLFGPPSMTLRWCCSVHKTTPQLLKIKQILKKDKFTEMAFVGVRRDESIRRSEYDYISYGTKHRGQYSCNPVLEWNSAEIYLYLFTNKLPINEAYKKGNARAGCLICPMASRKNDYMNFNCYKSVAEPLVNIIKDLNSTDKGDSSRIQSYIENDGWKARKNGRDLSIAHLDYDEEKTNAGVKIKFLSHQNIWQEWIKPLGTLINLSDGKYVLKYKSQEFYFNVQPIDNDYSIAFFDNSIVKHEPILLKLLKEVFRKAHYCVGCEVCEANCKYGCLKFDEKGRLTISDNCHHCLECYNIDTGCLVYKSLWLSKGVGNSMKKSLDCYANHAPKLDWFKQFLNATYDFNSENTLGKNELPIFKRFLRDAGILNGVELSILGRIFKSKGLDDISIWALMLVNLAYTPEINWYITNCNFNEYYSQKSMINDLENEGISASAKASIPNALRRISLLPFNEVGYGNVIDVNKENGFIMFRKPWADPDPKVILYSLYKFSEACGDYKQFTLTRLLNHEIESDGISPTQIFGLDRKTMERILSGLANNYPDFISVSFTLDLDNINLKDKTSEDVLSLFDGE